MEKYQATIKLFGELTELVDKIQQATQREDAEGYVKRSRIVIDSILLKLPYVDREIHDAAIKRSSEIIKMDTKASFEE